MSHFLCNSLHKTWLTPDLLFVRTGKEGIGEELSSLGCKPWEVFKVVSPPASLALGRESHCRWMRVDERDIVIIDH
jgi:hypothetical protein